MELLWVKDRRAFDIMGDFAGLFGDEGEPDGTAWLRPVEDLPADLVARLVEAGLAAIVEGDEGDYPPHYHGVPPIRECDGEPAQIWCGYTVEGKVYWSEE